MNSSYNQFLKLDTELKLKRNLGFVLVLVCWTEYTGVLPATWSNLTFLDILCSNYGQRISVGVMDNASN